MTKDEAYKILSEVKDTICFGCMHPQQFGWCDDHCSAQKAIRVAQECLINGKEDDMDTKEIYRCMICGAYLSHPKQIICYRCREALQKLLGYDVDALKPNYVKMLETVMDMKV